jgi:hypothetical protein
MVGTPPRVGGHPKMKRLRYLCRGRPDSIVEKGFEAKICENGVWCGLFAFHFPKRKAWVAVFGCFWGAPNQK